MPINEFIIPFPYIYIQFACKKRVYPHFAPQHFAPSHFVPISPPPLQSLRPSHFVPHTLRPTLCATIFCTTHFAPPHFVPHTLRPTLCAPILCAPKFCHTNTFFRKLNRSIALIYRPILLLSFVYALFKQNQRYGTHN